MAEFVQREAEEPLIMKAMCTIRSERARKATHFGIASSTRVDAVQELHLKALV